MWFTRGIYYVFPFLRAVCVYELIRRINWLCCAILRMLQQRPVCYTFHCCRTKLLSPRIRRVFIATEDKTKIRVIINRVMLFDFWFKQNVIHMFHFSCDLIPSSWTELSLSSAVCGERHDNLATRVLIKR